MFDPITTGIVIGLTVSLGSAGVIALFRHSYNKKRKKLEEDIKKYEELIRKIEDLCNEQTKSRKAIWRLNKAVVIMAKMLDQQTDKYHPEIASDLQTITEELLKDDVNS